MVEAHAELPSIAEMSISPNGKRLALLRPVGSTFGVTVIDLEQGNQNLALAAEPARYRLSECMWANDERILCRARSSANLPGRRTPARFMATSLIAVDHDGNNSRELLNDQRGPTFDRVARGAIVAVLPDDPRHILVPLPSPRRIAELENSVSAPVSELAPEVWKLDVYDDTRSRVVRERDGIEAWLADDRGTVQVGVARTAFMRGVVRDGDGFRTLDLARHGPQPDAYPIAVSRDGARITIAARLRSDRLGVHELSLVDGSVLRTLYDNERFDFDGEALVHDGEVQGLVVQDDHLRFVPLSPAFTTLADELARALPSEMLVPVGMDRAAVRFVVRSAVPHRPHDWYVYDRAARKLTRIGATYPKLADVAQPHSEWVRYQARDGLEIPALLTLPRAGAKNLPTILLPHGGPVARDHGDFDFLAAFLARRGYAVLQPQFRGSYGYGAAFLRRGLGGWGESMQDDVMDGLTHLRKQGIADPRRACVVGISYGGFSALVAAYKAADRLRCAASYAGVTDLPMLVRNRSLYRIDTRSARYLHLSVDSDRQEANSPARHAARFGIPVLLMHADLDTNVLVEQSRVLAAALTAAGKTHRYIEQTGGDHYLRVQAHRTQWLAELDRFLAEHLH